MKFLKLIVALCAILVCTMIAEAGERRSKRKAEAAVAVAKVSMVQPVSEVSNKPVAITKTAETASKSGSDNALDEVNEYRAKRGLAPFKHDPLLTQAAKLAADTRAKNLWAGHLQSDFACLPPGAHADSAGCGALEDSWGWGTCCADDNYSRAGAAWVRGSDGKRYMHLFVRHGEATTTKQTSIDPPQATGETVSAVGSCSTGTCSSGGFSTPMRFSGRRR